MKNETFFVKSAKEEGIEGSENNGQNSLSYKRGICGWPLSCLSKLLANINVEKNVKKRLGGGP